MSLFRGLFGGNSVAKKDEKILPWIPLQSINQLNEIEAKSAAKTQVIFKHSTTCGISRMVLNMFTDTYTVDPKRMDLYFLDLHAHRNVSNEVAVRFQVLHQSPQLLVIKNGATIFNTSHGAISEVALEEFV